jgi:pimeloyl-ACP methyl ester carboxylesterase
VRRRSGHRGQPTTLSRTLWMILLLLCVAGSTSAVSIASRQKMMLEREAARRRTAMGGRGGALPGKCEEAWFTQDVDHFGWGSANGSTWEQRYFLCESNEYRAPSPGVPRPIFFYVGNEANVELYVNATGLMWENAGEMGALMVFAEHRYYGKSWPFGSEQASTTRAHLRFLTHEQALADYANLITSLKQRLSLVASPVVAFGGSYGGMLAAWFRQKYPHIIVGAVAASAPVLAFGSWDSSKYWAAVTRDYTPDGGCSATCAQRIRSAWTPLFQMGETAEGLEDMSRLFRMCNPLSDADEAGQLALMLAMALDTTAMGNFPYPSTYVSDPNSPLPAWPVRSACAAMDVADPDDPISLLSGLRDAASVFYNSSGSLSCLELPDDQSYAGIWDYQWCTEALPQESYFKRTGEGDMFYEFSLSTTQIDAHCRF